MSEGVKSGAESLREKAESGLYRAEERLSHMASKAIGGMEGHHDTREEQIQRAVEEKAMQEVQQMQRAEAEREQAQLRRQLASSEHVEQPYHEVHRMTQAEADAIVARELRQLEQEEELKQRAAAEQREKRMAAQRAEEHVKRVARETEQRIAAVREEEARRDATRNIEPQMQQLSVQEEPITSRQQESVNAEQRWSDALRDSERARRQTAAELEAEAEQLGESDVQELERWDWESAAPGPAPQASLPPHNTEELRQERAAQPEAMRRTMEAVQQRREQREGKQQPPLEEKRPELASEAVMKQPSAGLVHIESSKEQQRA